MKLRYRAALWKGEPYGGHHTIQVAGMGDILILDLGDKKLDKYTSDKLHWSKMTWGGVVRYRGLSLLRPDRMMNRRCKPYGY